MKEGRHKEEWGVGETEGGRKRVRKEGGRREKGEGIK